MNISSARDRKVSFSCGELDTKNDGEASIGIACEQAFLFGRVKRVSRERASERRSREGQRKGELATIPYKFSFVLRPDEESGIRLVPRTCFSPLMQTGLFDVILAKRILQA